MGALPPLVASAHDRAPDLRLRRPRAGDGAAGVGGHPDARQRDGHAGRRLAGADRDSSPTSRSPKECPARGVASTPWSRCRSARSPSAASTSTTTARPLAVVQIATEREVPLADLLAALPDEQIGFTDRGGFETDDATYARTVERIIADEIGNGEGANLVIGRHFRAQLEDFGPETGPAKALTVLRRLLENERGAYWTYCFWTGDRFLIGASPERHVSVQAGAVRMNPISGTFRLRGLEACRAQGEAARLPRRREGDLRALHGRRRRAQDDVRHLPRGWPGARPVPQADDAPGAHRVPARRAHPLRRPRRAADEHVRRDRHRCSGRERVQADQAVRGRGPRLLRRGARPDRP